MQIRQFGMSHVVGLVSFPEEDGRSRRPYSKSLHSLMEVEAKQLVNRAYRHTEEVLKKNNDKLKKVKNWLLVNFLLTCTITIFVLQDIFFFKASRNFTAERNTEV